MHSDPQFIVFTGPMFGSKTTKMLSVIERYRYQRKKVAVFKPIIDERYAKSFISTHSGAKISATRIKEGEQILEYLSACEEKYDVIAVDEAFMIKGVASSLVSLFRKGYTVIVSSIQLSSSGQVFEEIRDILPWATKIQVCPAVCPVTGRDAFYTHRKVDLDKEIVVGGAETYEPRCWEHHPIMNDSSNFGD